MCVVWEYKDGLRCVSMHCHGDSFRFRNSEGFAMRKCLHLCVCFCFRYFGQGREKSINGAESTSQ